tara:strand:- start:6927 stop:9239 length:2313 start_codon:yes stop_codon:yes gene_type:complete
MEYSLDLVGRIWFESEEWLSGDTTGGSDVWGWTAPDGEEYAIMGILEGVAFVRASDMTVCDIVTGPSDNDYYYHRDIKTYGHYAYVAAEMIGTNQGLMIIDMSPLPDSVRFVDSYISGSDVRSHNLSIDTATGYAYILKQNYSGVRVVTLENPENPEDVGFINTANIHDVYARNDTVYIAEGSNGSFSIYDLTDKENPQLMARMDIPASGYVHNIWPSDDGNFAMTTEETTNKTVKIWDISDMNNIEFSGEYLGVNQIAHNTHIMGDFAYISHYTGGVMVLDISDPANPVEVTRYDTYALNDSPGFYGCWGAYPFTGNGYVYASDLEGYLTVLQFNMVEVEYEGPVWHVSTSGSDSTGDGSVEYPFATIQHGLNSASEGDSVLVAEGTYVENITWPATNGIKLIGSGEDDCIIDGDSLASVVRFEEELGGIIDNTTLISSFTIKNGWAHERLWDYEGGGIYLYNASPMLNNLIINDNKALFGGGIYSIYSNPIIRDALIINNHAHSGSGIVLWECSGVIISNVTISQNITTESNSHGGGIFMAKSHLKLLNSIIWDNSLEEVFFYHIYDPNSIMVDYSNIEGGEQGIITNDNGTLDWGDNNINSDPQFVYSENDDYSLQENSPCIDAGTAFFVWEGDTLVDLSEDEYEGTAPDMGAFEFPSTASVVNEPILPEKFVLHQNYPNPFNPVTTFKFTIPVETIGSIVSKRRSTGTSLQIFDINGRLVKTLLNKKLVAENYEITWDANGFPSGVYFYRLTLGNNQITRKMLLLK